MGIARVERLFENGLILGSDPGKKSRTVLSYRGPRRRAVGNDEAVILRRGNGDVRLDGSG